MATIKLILDQAAEVKNSKNDTNKQLIRFPEAGVLVGKGVTALKGMHNLHLTSDSPSLMKEEGFVLNVGDELTINVVDYAEIKAGETVNGKKYDQDRAAFKRFEVVGFTSAANVLLRERNTLAMKKEQNQIKFAENEHKAKLALMEKNPAIFADKFAGEAVDIEGRF